MKRPPSDYYDARRPGKGSIYVWELDKPFACELIRVVKVEWNGEQWWVETVSVPSRYHQDTSDDHIQLNELSRFWEAVTPVFETHVFPPPPLKHVQDQPCPCSDPERGG